MTNVYLPHKSVPWQVSTDLPGAARSVQCLGTTAPAAELFGNPEWMADMEYVWRIRTAAELARLDTRARRCRKLARDSPPETPRWRVVCERSAEWAEHRARSVAMARADVLGACETRWRAVACGCSRVEMRVGCDQPQLCGRCRKRHSMKWRKRIVAGMDAALRAERSSWFKNPRRKGKKPGIYLITLTAPHSGDLGTDRSSMGLAVRKLLKHAAKCGWWSTYALTWEATAGTLGDGHMHCHLAVISSWVPYAGSVMPRSQVPLEALEATKARALGEKAWPWECYRYRRGLREVWSDAMPGALVVDVKAPRNGADDAMSAGQYLAKYVTKGVDPSEFTGAKAGELLVAFRNRRKVSTSAGFWQRVEPRCECCGKLWTLAESPCSMQDIAPGAVLRSRAERLRWWIPRGEPQSALRWEPVVRPSR